MHQWGIEPRHAEQCAVTKPLIGRQVCLTRPVRTSSRFSFDFDERSQIGE